MHLDLVSYAEVNGRTPYDRIGMNAPRPRVIESDANESNGPDVRRERKHEQETRDREKGRETWRGLFRAPTKLPRGLFRAMGGDVTIGQSTINVMNGIRHRVNSTASDIFLLLLSAVFRSSFIELLLVATLTGVLFMMVIRYSSGKPL